MKKKLKFIKAQNFKIPSTDGKIFELNKIKNKYIVIYFYPKDDTPGCTIETNDFNSLLPKFKKLDCLVIGISKDNIESHLKFKKKYNIKFDLLADEKKEAIKESYIALVQKRWDAESGEALPDQERQYSLSELEREKERCDADMAKAKAESDGLKAAIADYKKL